MTAKVYRGPTPVVKRGKALSVVQDNGSLMNAHRSGGNYLFSEVGVGTRPLAIIGSRNDVYRLLKVNQHWGVENRIGDLPEIYIGFCHYRPGERYKGLFPVHDFASGVVKKLANAPAAIATGGGMSPDSFNPVKAGRAIGKVIKTFRMDRPGVRSGRPNAHEDIYMKISYLPERGTQQVGAGYVSFDEIREWFRAKLYA